MNASGKERLYYLDWLRIGAFGLLIFFHCFRFFDFFPWHVKNAEQSEWITQFVVFTTSWRMPLIFFVSGAGTYFALRSRGAAFVNDRVRRLVIPYIFGILILIPPQKYFEYLFYGGDAVSYPAFLKIYPQQLIEPDLGFSMVWLGHVGYNIWYLAYLFVQTLLLLPLLRWMVKSPPQLAFLKRRPLNLLWLFVPLIAINLVLRPAFPDYLHWADFFHFLFFFLMGFLFTTYRQQLAGWVAANLRLLLFIAVATSMVTHYFALFTENVASWLDAPGYYADYFGFVFIRTTNALSWVLVLLGLAIRYLDRSHPWLTRLNEAVLPVYILHQTIIIAIGFYIVQWSVGIPAKAAMVLASASLLIFVCYQVVRRVPPLRVLFGMKPNAS